MKLRSLQLTNFRSFKGHQTFHFPDGPGLYFMWGDNQAEPRLGRNGAGKSTLWKALTWLFYAKTSEGLKAGDAANWEAGKGTRVCLEFTDTGLSWVVERTWSPNTWVLKDTLGNVFDLTKDPTNPVLGVLALEFQPFLSCILMAQGQPMFLDLKAEAKAALFAEVMSLDKWLEYSTRASSSASAIDKDLRSAEAQVSRLKGQVQTARDVDVTVQLEDWEAGRQLRRKGLEHEYKGLLQRLGDLKARMVERDVTVVECRARYKIALESVEDAEAQLKRAHQGAYGKTSSHSCPSCGQGIPDSVSLLIDKLAAARKAASEALRLMDDAGASVRSCERDILSVNKTLDALEEREDQIIAEVNPFASVRADAQQRLEDLEADLRAAYALQDDLAERYSISSGWVRWFKEIRLELIGEALRQLEVEVNNCVTSMGLVNWELRFDVDRETAKGTLQKGFAVTVLSPHNEKAVPWEAWSGGEAQRLRLATNMGLANLIRARTGTTLNLEVWDEPSQHMGEQGVADLLDSLKARAYAEQRQIWIVDHNTLGYSDFDGQAGVVKTAAGSHFSQDTPYNSGHEHTRPSATTRRSTIPAVVRRR